VTTIPALVGSSANEGAPDAIAGTGTLLQSLDGLTAFCYSDKTALVAYRGDSLTGLGDLSAKLVAPDVSVRTGYLLQSGLILFIIILKSHRLSVIHGAMT